MTPRRACSSVSPGLTGSQNPAKERVFQHRRAIEKCLEIAFCWRKADRSRACRKFVSVMRTLMIVLLILRVFRIIHPLTMRPNSPRAPRKNRLVMRVCAWPAQPPKRSISATSLDARFPRQRSNQRRSLGATEFGPRSIFALTQSVLSRLVDSVPQGSSSGQNSVRLRC